MKLRRVVGPGPWSVLAVCADRGDCPLLLFFRSLEQDLAKDRDRMLRLLKRTSENGPIKNTFISHQISGKIYEFIQGRLRVLYFTDAGKLVVCSHGFVKKSPKTPPAEIARAQRCLERYLEAKVLERLQILE